MDWSTLEAKSEEFPESSSVQLNGRTSTVKKTRLRRQTYCVTHLFNLFCLEGVEHVPAWSSSGLNRSVNFILQLLTDVAHSIFLPHLFPLLPSPLQMVKRGTVWHRKCVRLRLFIGKKKKAPCVHVCIPSIPSTGHSGKQYFGLQWII